MAAHGQTVDSLAFPALVERAALRYRTSGRSAYYFCRGKLGGDPVFAALLRDGYIRDGAKILDLGCGQGVLAALLLASDTARSWTLFGLDLRARAIGLAQRATAGLGAQIRFQVGDIRTTALPPADLAVIFDVLHYIDYPAQQLVLARVHDALAADGRLLLRVGDPERGWRFRVTLVTDWIATAARGTLQRKFWCRPLRSWIALLEAIGFEVHAQPMSAGTPFANVLLVAVKRGAASVR